MNKYTALLLVFLISSCAWKKEDKGAPVVDRSNLVTDLDKDGIPDDKERDQFERISFNIPRFIPTQISSIEWIVEDELAEGVRYSRELYTNIEPFKRDITINSYFKETTGRAANGFKFVEQYKVFEADQEFKNYVGKIELLQKEKNFKVKSIKGNFLLNFKALDFVVFSAVKRFDVQLRAFDGKRLSTIASKTYDVEEHSITGLTKLNILEKNILTPVYFDFEVDATNLINESTEFIVEINNIEAVIDGDVINITNLENEIRKRRFGVHFISEQGLKKFYVNTAKTVKDSIASVFEKTEFEGDSILNIDDSYSEGESHPITKLLDISKRELDQAVFKKIVSNNLALDNPSYAGGEIIIIHQKQSATLDQATVFQTQIDRVVSNHNGISRDVLEVVGREDELTEEISFRSKAKEFIVKFLNPVNEKLTYSTRSSFEPHIYKHCRQVQDYRATYTECDWRNHPSNKCEKRYTYASNLHKEPFSSLDLADFDTSTDLNFEEVLSDSSSVGEMSATYLYLSRNNLLNDDFVLNIAKANADTSKVIGYAGRRQHCSGHNLRSGTGTQTITEHLNKNFHLLVKSKEFLDFDLYINSKEE